MSRYLQGNPGVLALLLATLAAYLAAVPGARAQPTNIAAELVAANAARPGGETTLAIHMRPGAGWHGYWLNPGDAGFGMSLDWDVPDGAKAGEPRYPVPTTLLISGLMNHVYKGDYAVLVPFTLPEDAVPGTTLPISVKAQWLACTDEVCVPEQATLRASIEVARDPLQVGPPRIDSRFERWTRMLPAPLDAASSFAITSRNIRFAIPLPADLTLEDPHLFVAEDRLVDYAAPQRFSRSGDQLIVELERTASAPAEPGKISGVLRLDNAGNGLAFEALPGQVPAAGQPLAGGAQPFASLPLLLLAALAGGLLLNVMPCVFPILSLKALSLARAGESDAQARSEGIAYTGGVIVATLALGGLLLALRAAGEQVGWAFQLQEPGVVVALLLLATAITANFLGLFEIAAPSLESRGSKRGAFATGLLAAFVATPCTGPFMAAAMGAALLLPVVPALALFAALGLGLALPFLAVAFIPALRSRLPRPGPWMETFRRWMAVPMGLTVVALAWLASRVGGDRFALGAIILALLLLGLLALIGRRQRQGGTGAMAMLAGLAGLAIASSVILPEVAPPRAADDAGESLLAAVPFNASELERARASGRPVFAWFTADWCITCKVNEQVAIEREETARAFAQAGVVVLRGDWTRRDPAITRYLTAQGAAGVPLYVWYPAGGGEPEVLPQVLTPDMLVTRAEASATGSRSPSGS